MFPMRLKRGFVILLSCFALLLGLLAPTGIASAHSVQAQKSAGASIASCSKYYVRNIDGVDVTVPNPKCLRSVYSV
jgi:hypothetical protein